MSKYMIITFGCQMNKSDSERVKTVLDGLGMTETIVETEADFILINTCSVRQSAEDRVYGFMRKYDMELRKNKPNLILGVTGCMPGRDKEGKFRENLPMIDLYFKIDDVIKLPKWLMALNPDIGKDKKWDSNQPLDYLKLEPKYKNNYQMFLPIQTGCNRFCTYCVVPYARGLERNRTFEDIMVEARKFVKNGGVEITLLGQTVNSYEFPEEDEPKLSESNPYKTGFAALLYELNELEGLRRIFYTAPHPDDMNDECIDALALSKVLSYLHLPVQSGSNDVLKSMKRSYTREEFLEVIRKIKNKVPNIALGTDIIVGFSGETDADFEDTVSMYKEVDFDISYTAKYSIRSGTFAAKKMEDTVSYEEKDRRWKILKDLMEETTYRKNQKFQDMVVEVLFDKYKDGIATGWSREMKMVQVPSDKSLIGKVLKVKVTSAKTWVLEGVLK